MRRYTGLPCPGTQSRPTDACRFARTQLFLWHCTTHVLQTAAVAANVADGTSLGCGASACPRFIHLRPSTRSWVCPSVALRVSVCLALALARSLSVSLSLCLSLSLSLCVDPACRPSSVVFISLHPAGYVSVCSPFCSCACILCISRSYCIPSSYDDCFPVLPCACERIHVCPSYSYRSVYLFIYLT